MPNMPPRFNYGAEIKNINETLYNQLSDTFSLTARTVNQKPNKNVTTLDPPADAQQNMSYEIGDLWINTSSDTAWIMTSRQTNTQATWTQIT